jgi:ABC-2 type transport system permease protein
MYHGLWYAPLYAWLLLASAWATRVPFLWAALPPLGIGIVERIAFDSAHFATLVGNHLAGPADGASTTGTSVTLDMLASHPVSHYLTSVELWTGLALSVLFLFGAARLRRARGVM